MALSKLMKRLLQTEGKFVVNLIFKTNLIYMLGLEIGGQNITLRILAPISWGETWK